MAASSYATPADLALYLPTVPSAGQDGIWTVLLSAASRFIDDKLGQHFYDDAPAYTRYFDGQGTNVIDTQAPFFCSSGTIAACAQGATSLTFTSSRLAPAAPQVGDLLTLDVLPANQEQVTISAVAGTGPYTLTTSATQYAHAASTVATTIEFSLAYYENQPLAQRINLAAGDGVTPPTNFYLWPRIRSNVGSTLAPSGRRPWYGVEIAAIPISATSYLPSTIPGKATVGITAHWGWQAVPDEIKDLCCKLAARAWRARESGWSESLGTNEMGVVQMLRRLDPIDEFTLLSSDLLHTVY